MLFPSKSTDEIVPPKVIYAKPDPDYSEKLKRRSTDPAKVALLTVRESVCENT
jgi:hypothetical protein